MTGGRSSTRALVVALGWLLVGCAAEHEATTELVELPKLDPARVEPFLADRFLERRQAIAAADGSAARAQASGELGELAHRYELYELADAAYANAATLAPAEVRWPYLRALVLLSRGAEEAAVAELERALAIDRRQIPALVRLGDQHLAADRPTEAAAAYGRALAIEPGSAAALAGLGRAELHRRRFAAAAAALEKALALTPAARSLHHPLSEAYRGLGDGERAGEHWQRRGSGAVPLPDPLLASVRAQDPGVAALVQRGSLALDARRFDAAADAFRKALALDPYDGEARHLLANALAAGGDFAAAEPEFRRAIAGAPASPRLRFDFGSRLGQTGRLDEAIEELRRAVELAPGMLEAHHNLGAALARDDRLDAAIAAFGDALAVDPRHAGSRYLRARARLDGGDDDGALADLRQLIGEHPAHAAGRAELGHLLHRRGDRAGAIAQFREAARLEPRRIGALINLATLLERDGQPEAALTAWRRVSAADPRRREAWLGELRGLAELERCGEARARFDVALQHLRDLTQPAAMVARCGG